MRPVLFARLIQARRRRTARRPSPVRLRMQALEDRTVPSVSLAYVDDTWAGTANGNSPTPAPTSGLAFGTDAFPDIQSALDALMDGGTLVVFGGAYPGAVNVNKAVAPIQVATNPGTTTQTLVTINGPLTLTSSTTFEQTGATNLTFGSAINGATPGTASLTVNGSNTTTFNSGVGHTVALAALTTDAGGSTVFTTGVITEFSDGFSTNSSPHGIAVGPDGNFWFAAYRTISRMTPGGVVTEFSTGPSNSSSPRNITPGPDGNLWYTVPLGSRIGRITPDGVITEFTTGITAGSLPICITAGPDGNLWFTVPNRSRIGRITPSGVVTEFTTGITADPIDITAGPDGNLWFTEDSGNRIGRITPDGQVTEFSAGISPDNEPSGIAAGPDGNLWFTTHSGNRIGRITPDGQITEFSAGISAGGSPFAIAAGPDGNLWFTESWGNRIGRITPDGQVTEFSAGLSPGRQLSDGQGITVGPDGNLWFTETDGNRIGRITVGGLVTTTGPQIYNSAVILGTDATLTSTAGDIVFAGTVNGDGSGPRKLTVTTASPNAGSKFPGTVGNVNPLAGLTLNSTGLVNIVGAIHGSGTLTKSGAGALGGTGTVQGPVTVVGGTLAPGTSLGVLHTGTLTLGPGSTYAVDLKSPYVTAGNDYDQTSVTGGVSIDGGVLQLVGGATAPTPGQMLTIIANDGTDAVTVLNPFVTSAGAPLPEGSTVTVGAFTATLSYRGGDGNDVVLIVAGPPPRVTDVQINDGSAQRSRVTSLTVTFNTVVTLPADAATAFFLTRINGGIVGGFTGGFTAMASIVDGVTVVTLSSFRGPETEFGSLVDGRYSLLVFAGSVSAGGRNLDGNGDGTGGDNFMFADSGGSAGPQFYRLFGDANGDRVVNGSDLTPFIQQFGGLNPTFDFNGDGVVNGTDLTEFVKNFGRGV